MKGRARNKRRLIVDPEVLDAFEGIGKYDPLPIVRTLQIDQDWEYRRGHLPYYQVGLGRLVHTS